MASEIMARIGEAELEFDRRLAAAKSEASASVSAAVSAAAAQKEENVLKAKIKAAEIIEVAQHKALIYAQGSAREDEKAVEEMKKNARTHSAEAITAVAKRLAELR